MEHAKKMAIVPTEVLDALRQNQSKSQTMVPASTKNLLSLDREMKQILERDDLDEYQKATRYQQSLQQFLTFHKQKQKPLAVNIVQNKPSPNDTSEAANDQPSAMDDDSVKEIFEDIVNSVPKNMRGKAKQIMTKISAHSDIMSWNDRGELVYNGSTIPNSNLHDLILDVLRINSPKFDPIGHKQFIRAMADINMPESLISNSKRRSLIREYKEKGYEGYSKHDSVPALSKLPITKKKSSKSRVGQRSQNVRGDLWEEY